MKTRVNRKEETNDRRQWVGINSWVIARGGEPAAIQNLKVEYSNKIQQTKTGNEAKNK